MITVSNGMVNNTDGSTEIDNSFHIAVTNVCEQINVKTGLSTKEYTVEVSTDNGTKRKTVINRLSRLRLFEDFNIPNCVLDKKHMEQLESALQHDACYHAKQETIYLVPQGLSKYEDFVFCALGDKILCPDGVKSVAYGNESLRLRNNNMNDGELADAAQKYITLNSTSSVIFYAALVTCALPFIAPILEDAGYESGVAFSLVGPASSGKTTLARLFTEWFRSSNQEIHISSSISDKDIIQNLSLFYGANLVVDDARRTFGNERIRMLNRYDKIIRVAYDIRHPSAVVWFTRESDEGVFDHGIASTFSRQLDIPVSPVKGQELDDLKKKLLKLKREDLIPAIAWRFIERLYYYGEMQLKKLVYDALEETEKNLNHVEEIRIRDIAVVLRVTEYLYRTLLCQGNALLSNYLCFCQRLNEILERQAMLIHTKNSEEDLQEIVEKIRTTMGAMKYVVPHEYDSTQTAVYTDVDDMYYVVTSSNLQCALYQHTGINVTDKQIGKALSMANMILRESNVKNTRHYIDCKKKNQRHFWIIRGKLCEPSK